MLWTACNKGLLITWPRRFQPDVVVARLHGFFERERDRRPTQAAAMSSSVEHLGVVGRSAAMAKVFATIEKISRYKANVLLLGESGSGKELIAGALHARGPRRRSLFVPINCATLGRDLLENELFGHERGGFTGAHERKRGLFELADGGTLFLDEIGELDPLTQPSFCACSSATPFAGWAEPRWSAWISA